MVDCLENFLHNFNSEDLNYIFLKSDYFEVKMAFGVMKNNNLNYFAIVITLLKLAVKKLADEQIKSSHPV